MRTRTRIRLLPLLLAAAILGLAVFLIFRLLHREPPDPHAGQVRIYDGFDWVWMTPLEGVDANPLTADDFSLQGTLPVYQGADYEVLRGLDVSEHQHGIDWQQVAASGVDYAFIRLGRRGYTEGGLFEDPYYQANMAGARDAGIPVGVYFFSQAISVQEALEEARFVLERLAPYRLDYPVVFDWEKIPDTPDARTNNLSMEARTDCAVAFCETVKNAGYRPCVYFNRNLGYYGYDLTRLTDYDFWFSLPEMGYPSFYYAVDYWQYSFTESVPGVETPADMNLLFLPVPAEEEQEPG